MIVTFNVANLAGVFDQKELKVISPRSPLRISGIVDKYLQNKIWIYICTVEGLPRNFLLKLKKYQLDKYRFTPAARQQLNKK